MELKVQWLFARRQQIATEMTESDGQLREMVEGLVREVESGKKEMAAMRDGVRDAEVAHREETGKLQLQVKTLEGLVISKDDAIQQLKATNAQLQANAQDKNTSNQQYYARLLQLEHLLTVEKSQAERAAITYSKELQSRSEAHLLELARAKKDFDEQLADIQNSMTKAHQQELADLKKSNLQLLQRLDEEQQTLTVKSTENSRKNQAECGRLIAENTRLLATTNDCKLKIMTLQANLASQTQQARILQKQLQIFKESSKREIAFLTEQRTTLADKNRKMSEKLDELAWANKDGEIRKAQEMERIKREIDRSFQEVLEKAREERSALEEENQHLRNALQEKTQELHEMQQVSMRIKELFQSQERDMLKLQQEKQAIQRQLQAAQQSLPIKANEQLKKELIRKNCEAEVLQEEIKRLKGRVNTAAAAQQQFTRAKQALLEQNKMLLGQILFLKKQKERGRKGGQSRISRSGNFLSEIDSQRSRDDGELQQYKKVIEMMTAQMNEVCQTVKEKDARIDKLQALVRRYERELRDGI